MQSFGDIPLQNRLKRWSKYIIGAIILGAVIVLIGWELDIDYFKSPLRGSEEMNPTAAAAFIFSGFSFLLLTSTPFSKSKQNIGKLLALFVLLIGGAKLFFYITGIDLYVDQLLFPGKIGTDRIVPMSSVCFILTGVSLLLVHTKGKNHERLSDSILLLLISFSLFSILGYFFHVNLFYGLITYVPMAIHAAIFFLFLSLSVFFYNSDKGLMKSLTSILAGSIAARRLIPAAILVPVLLGILRTKAQQEAVFTIEFGLTILIFAIIVVLLSIIWHNTVLLNKRDLQRQKAEKAQRQSEEQIQTIFSSAPDAVIVINEEGTIIKWNPKAETIFGWHSYEVVGKALQETIIPPRFREAHRAGLRHFLQTGEGPVLGKTIEIQAINKNNTELDAALSISPTIVDGKYLFIGFVRDITDRKHAEAIIQKQKQDIQDFIDSMSTMCAKVATDGRLLLVNKIAIRASGLPFEDLMNTNFLEGQWWTYDPEVHEKVCKAFKKACSGIAINYDENIFAFGQVLPINFSLMPILGLDGNVDYIVAEGRDIASIKLTEAALQKQTSELEQANRELEAFSYSVSHDLRAPLRIIDGYSEIVVNEYGGKLDEEGGKMLGVIRENAAKMGQLIDDLLNLSRLGRKELIIQPVNMKKMVESVVAEQTNSQRRQIKIEIGELDNAEGDGNLLRQVWVNLISNAVKYSRSKEKPVIHINSEVTAHETVYSIKDNGAGFNMKYADKLFGVFQRLHKMTEYEGTGVGLALVHRIITRHGGRVWAEAEVNKGATFYFSLPVQHVEKSFNQERQYQTT